MSTTTDRMERELLVAREQIRNLNLMLGEKQAELAHVAKQRNSLKRRVLDLQAASDRTEAAIDSIKHLGLRRLFWLARGNELESLFAAGADTFELRVLVKDLLDAKSGDVAEHIVRRSMGLDG